MRLTWSESVDEGFYSERTNILPDDIEIYAEQKLAVISENDIVSTNKVNASSLFAGNPLGLNYMTKACQVQEGE